MSKSGKDRDCPTFSLKDITVSALGLAVAIPWTDAIKNGMNRDSIIFAIKVTIIVAIIAIIISHLHLFAKQVKNDPDDHPLKILSAFESIW